ncbi:MAG: hypothetical protein N3G19_03590, partial [Candidatus Pacearchaeota archaeon]|nr:hypothetical protein [Candidatus Pacearchaeota archaeon]
PAELPEAPFNITTSKNMMMGFALGVILALALIFLMEIMDHTFKKPEDVDKLDLNERVKRILKSRLAEFLEWKERSEAELRKRFEVEKSWVKSQVSSLKLYTRWAKPYLKAAEELMMKGTAKEPAITKAFNTVILQLTLLGKNKINVQSEVDAGNLPKAFRNMKLKRNYYACVLVDFKFRGIPRRGAGESGYYVFGGRADINFKAFALNEDEFNALNNESDNEDFRDALKLVENLTEETLSNMISEIEHFIGKEKEKEKKEKKKEPKEIEVGKIKKDSFEESLIRKLAERKAAELCFKIYDIYKKSHGMASFAEPEWEMPPRWRIQ